MYIHALDIDALIIIIKRIVFKCNQDFQRILSVVLAFC